MDNLDVLVKNQMNWHDNVNNNFSKIKGHADEVENKLENLYNPNLLINSNFKISKLINQRGETNYTYGGNGYKFDQFLLTTSALETQTSLDLTGTNVKWLRTVQTSVSDTRSYLFQRLENSAEFAGKTLTLTVRAKVTAGHTTHLHISNGVGAIEDATKAYVGTGEYEVMTYTRYIHPEVTFIHVGISDFTNEPFEVEIDYMKLELGEVSTPFVDDDQATKLLKCQRYLQVFKGQDIISLGYIRALNTRDTALFNINLINSMRIDAPTLTLGNTNMIIGINKGGAKPLTSLSITPSYAKAKQGIINFYASTDDITSLAIGDGARLQSLNSDDYIMLSAEL